jgi:hypothetical protein
MMMSDIYPLIEDYLCTTTLEVAAAGTEGLAEVSGNANTILEPGETWQFTPKVRNMACAENAFGVTADIEANPASTGPVVLTNGAASFGDVPASTTATSVLPVVFELDLTATCGEDVVFDMTNLTATNGGPFPGQTGLITIAVGELVYTTIMLESFAGGIPVDWTVVHNGTATGAAATWTTDNPGGRTVSLTAPFAIVDSDHAGSGATHDEELISPVVDCTGYPNVSLRFNHHFEWYSAGGNEQADVEVRSTATGGSWVNVANYSGGSASGNEVIDISAHAADQSDVQLRFRYYDASFDWYWAVDDIELITSEFVCGDEVMFADDFEAGNTDRWSVVIP